ncbi:hypothetical protein K438DRAFT_1589597 [Mycena galopus ATCC 62051]|nr:hypothetical protein K438DRAFT_1589597 [Mycena galopus ATCC 62051]
MTEVADEDTRVEDLWFFDGSLVIKAGAKLFRVYKAQLAARSTVFKAMIESGIPENQGDELIDGIPVVVLHDAAEDVEVFLRAIFDSSYFMPSPERAYFTDVIAILRLSHKYDVEYLHRRALQHLEVDFYRGSVEEYMTIKSRHLKYNRTHGHNLRYSTLIGAALEVGALWLLPMAYYAFSFRKFEALLSILSDNDANHPYVRTCLAGWHRMMRANIDLHRFLLQAEPRPYCLKPNGTCTVAHNTWRTMVVDFDEGICAPFDSWELMISTAKVAADFCIPCHAAATKNMQRALDIFWNDLPSYFDLPGWSDLNAMKEAAMGRGSS